MFWAMTSVRLDSERRDLLGPGHPLVLDVLDRRASRATAWLISTSMPLALLVAGSSIECGAMSDSPSVMPVLDRPRRASRRRSSRTAGRTRCRASAPRPAAAPARVDEPRRSRPHEPTASSTVPAHRLLTRSGVGEPQPRTRYFSTISMLGSTPRPGSSGTRHAAVLELERVLRQRPADLRGLDAVFEHQRVRHRRQEVQRGRGVDVGREVVVGDRDAALRARTRRS